MNCLLFGVFLLQHLPVLCVYLFVCFHHCVSLLWAFCLILPLPHKTAPDGPIVPPGWIKFLFDVHLNPFPFFLPPFGFILACRARWTHLTLSQSVRKDALSDPKPSGQMHTVHAALPHPLTHPHLLIPLWLNPDVRQMHVTNTHTRVRAAVVRTCDREVGD